MAGREQTILFESEHLRVSSLLKPQAAVVFVTFNEMGYRPQGASFWGDGVFAPTPFAAVGVVSKTPNWYPAADMREAAARIRQATPGACRIAYGVSQGGYGALKFSAALEAAGALAFGPQWSIDPADVGGFDPRYAEYFHPALDNGRRIVCEDLSGPAFVFYDPYHAVDARNVDRLRALPGVHAVACPFFGHAVAPVLAEAHGGVGFLTEAAALIRGAGHTPDIAARLRQRLRAARGKSGIYATERSTQLRARNKVSLLAGVRRRSPDALTPAALLYVAVREDDAETVGRLIPVLKFDEIVGAGAIETWMCVRKAGLDAAELRLADLFLGEAKYTFLRLHAVNSYMKHNMRHVARLALREIVASDGVPSADVARIVSHFAEALGLPDLRQRAQEALASESATGSFPTGG